MDQHLCTLNNLLLAVVHGDWQRSLQLVNAQRMTDNTVLSSTWGVYIIPLPLKAKGSGQQRGKRECKSQRQWMATMEHCFLHRTRQLHISAVVTGARLSHKIRTWRKWSHILLLAKETLTTDSFCEKKSWFSFQCDLNHVPTDGLTPGSF